MLLATLKYKIHGYLASGIKTLSSHSLCDFQEPIELFDNSFTSDDTFEQVLEIGLCSSRSVKPWVEILRFKYEVD